MKKYLLFATALVALASCSTDELESPSVNNVGNNNAIAFTSISKGITRADHVGADAAALLNNKFVVSGFKGAGDVTATVTATGTVFDNYIVKWTENTAATTASNTSDWEYVGTKAEAPSTLDGNTQSIKYWDYSADQYDFIAYSTGDAEIVTSGTAAEAIAANKVLVTAIDPANAKTKAYQLSGNAADLKKCYIADMVTAYKDGTDASHKYQDEVTLTFRSLASKVRMAIYETVPGYSVKDVKFYTDATTTLATGASATDATLFTTGSDANNFYSAGTYTVSFPTIGKSNFTNTDYNKAHVSFTVVGNGKGTTKTFGSLNLVGREHKEAEATNYVGRTSATASFAGTATPYYQTVLPNEAGAVLELRVDYTLLSIDGSGEEIKVHGATAFVPAIYAAWKSNYAYTYIFKISDNTKGWTSTVESDPAGLYPITFDAVVAETEDFTQSAITTVASPSITTYQKGHDITKDEYAADDIYVQVMTNGTLNNDLGTKGQLYTVTARTGKTITEADVMDALNIVESTSGDATTGRNGWEITKATSDATVTAIPGADGNDITVVAGTAAKFTAAAGTYAYVYKVSDGTASDYYTAVTLTAQPDDWSTTGLYFTDPNGATAAPTTYADGTYYKKYTNLNNVYGVKVIKVQ